MTIFVVWCETRHSGDTAVVGYCKTKELAERSITVWGEMHYSPDRYRMWFEEIPELLED